MTQLTSYITKPNAAYNTINTRLAANYGIGSLWSPEFSNVALVPQLGSSETTYDRMNPNILFERVEAGGNVPLVGTDASGSSNYFNNTGTNKTTGGRAWVTTDVVCHAARTQECTMFAVGHGFASTAMRFLAQGPFAFGYRQDQSKVRFEHGLFNTDVVLPYDGDDGDEHSWVVTYSPAGDSPRVNFYFDGVHYEQLAGPTAALTDTVLRVGNKNASQINGWNGHISLAGMSDQIWDGVTVSRFAQSPFEVLYPANLRRRVPVVVSERITATPSARARVGAEAFVGQALGTKSHAGPRVDSDLGVDEAIGTKPHAGPRVASSTNIKSE